DLTDTCISRAYEARSFGRSDTLPPTSLQGAPTAFRPTRTPVENPAMISTSAVRRVLVAAALVLAAAACAPEPAAPPAAVGPSCAPGALSTLTAGTLTFGTDQPVYPPWYLDDDPASG